MTNITARHPGHIAATAIRVDEFGGPEVMRLETVELDPPGEGEVLVRVAAAGVGPWDAWVRSGKSVLPQPLPLTPGSDIAGVIEAVGPSVQSCSPGMEVYGATNERFTNGYGTRAIAKAGMIARKPRTLNFVEAASAPVIAVTAWQMLFDHAGLSRGKSALIMGAAGGVGAYTVQLARNAGVRVVASDLAGSGDRLRNYGAETVIGPVDDPETRLPHELDAVIDLVGGASQARAMEALAPNGMLISSVSQPDEERARSLGVDARFILVDVNTRVLDRLAAEFDAGRLKAEVGTVLPLADAVKAHEMLEGRLPKRPGKLVLPID
jgi:NADPH:quinone reductase-like Zn-dependent oxidoreductase